jgi:hypothetical protein
VETICYGFWWGGRERIARKSLIGDIEEGGINMIDVQAHFEAVKAAWIPQIVNNAGKTWSKIPQMYMDVFGPNNIILKMTFIDQKCFPPLNK